MWIEYTITDDDGAPTTTQLKTPHMDAPVAFSSTGKAQVTQDVGNHLVDAFDEVVPVETDDSDTSGTSDGDAGDTPATSEDDAHDADEDA